MSESESRDGCQTLKRKTSERMSANEMRLKEKTEKTYSLVKHSQSKQRKRASHSHFHLREKERERDGKEITGKDKRKQEKVKFFTTQSFV